MSKPTKNLLEAAANILVDQALDEAKAVIIDDYKKDLHAKGFRYPHPEYIKKMHDFVQGLIKGRPDVAIHPVQEEEDLDESVVLKNEGYGFGGTINGDKDDHVKKIVPHLKRELNNALVQHHARDRAAAKVLGSSSSASVRRSKLKVGSKMMGHFLDSSHGRHLADQLNGGVKHDDPKMHAHLKQSAYHFLKDYHPSQYSESEGTTGFDQGPELDEGLHAALMGNLANGHKMKDMENELARKTRELRDLDKKHGNNARVPGTQRHYLHKHITDMQKQVDAHNEAFRKRLRESEELNEAAGPGSKIILAARQGRGGGHDRIQITTQPNGAHYVDAKYDRSDDPHNPSRHGSDQSLANYTSARGDEGTKEKRERLHKALQAAHATGDHKKVLATMREHGYSHHNWEVVHHNYVSGKKTVKEDEQLEEGFLTRTPTFSNREKNVIEKITNRLNTTTGGPTAPFQSWKHDDLHQMARDHGLTEPQCKGAIDFAVKQSEAKRYGNDSTGFTYRKAQKVTEGVEEGLDEAVGVDDSRWKRSHYGTGMTKGRGNWIIGKHKGGWEPHHKEGEDHITHNGKYSEAVKAAKEWAKSKGVQTVHIYEGSEELAGLELIESHVTIDAARNKKKRCDNEHPTTAHSVVRGRRSGKYFVVRAHSGMEHVVESNDDLQFRADMFDLLGEEFDLINEDAGIDGPAGEANVDASTKGTKAKKDSKDAQNARTPAVTLGPVADVSDGLAGSSGTVSESYLEARGTAMDKASRLKNLIKK